MKNSALSITILKYSFLFFTLFSLSCKESKFSKPSNESIENFELFLDRNNLIKSHKNGGLFVLLQPNFCGSCTIQVQEYVLKEFMHCSLSKTIVFSNADSELISKFEDLEDVNVYVDSLSHLKKYGLINGLEFSLLLNKGEKESYLINLENIEKGLRLCP